MDFLVKHASYDMSEKGPKIQTYHEREDENIGGGGRREG